MTTPRPHYGGPRRRTTAEFIVLAEATHGAGRYDYSAVRYETAHVKILIGCPAHGAFLQSAHSHLSGKGCAACGNIKRIASNSFDIEWFVAKSKMVHGDIFDYSETVYLGTVLKLTIRCKIHGHFTQEAGSHLQGTGCPRCAQAQMGKWRIVQLDEFIARAVVLHGAGRYDYSAVELDAQIVPVTIICPSHGPFTQRPHKHLQGDGCPVCAESRGEREVRKALTSMGLEFVSQWRHPALRHKRPLYIDFALPAERIAIEFDGAQHHRPVNFRGISDERARFLFEKTKIRDAVKTAWAVSEGWTLVRLTNPEAVADDLRVALAHLLGAAAAS